MANGQCLKKLEPVQSLLFSPQMLCSEAPQTPIDNSPLFVNDDYGWNEEPCQGRMKLRKTETQEQDQFDWNTNNSNILQQQSLDLGTGNLIHGRGVTEKQLPQDPSLNVLNPGPLPWMGQNWQTDLQSDFVDQQKSLNPNPTDLWNSNFSAPGENTDTSTPVSSSIY